MKNTGPLAYYFYTKLTNRAVSNVVGVHVTYDVDWLMSYMMSFRNQLLMSWPATAGLCYLRVAVAAAAEPENGTHEY